MFIILTICVLIISVATIRTDEVSSKIANIKTDLAFIGDIVAQKDEQIKHLQMALLKSQMIEETAAHSLENNITEVQAKNMKLEKAVVSLKEVIQDSSNKIIDLETKYRNCVGNSKQKDQIIKKLEFELEEGQMYKTFFNNVINQLKNFNKTGLLMDSNSRYLKDVFHTIFSALGQKANLI